MERPAVGTLLLLAAVIAGQVWGAAAQVVVPPPMTDGLKRDSECPNPPSLAPFGQG